MGQYLKKFEQQSDIVCFVTIWRHYTNNLCTSSLPFHIHSLWVSYEVCCNLDCLTVLHILYVQVALNELLKSNIIFFTLLRERCWKCSSFVKASESSWVVEKSLIV